MLRVLFVLLVVAGPARADVAGGIRAFRAERYEEALRLLAPDRAQPEARFFEGAALYKLGRHEEALEALDEALDRDPALAGEVGSLYRGLTQYALRLFHAARLSFTRVVELNPGGRLAQVAREHLAALAGLHGDERAAAGWYLDRGLSFAAAGRPRLTAAFLQEARTLDAALRPDLTALHLSAALNALGRPADALAAIGAVDGAGAQVQRGRALLALGRRQEAKVQLTSAAASKDAAWAEAARALLESGR